MSTSGSSDGRARRPRSGGRLAGILLLAALAIGLRAPTIGAAYPYLNYVDEGHILHRVTRILGVPTWDPGWYYYPTLPAYTIAAVAAAAAPAYRVAYGRALRGDLSPTPPFAYERVAPGALLLVGRLVCLAVSLLVVAQVGLLAARLGGSAAGWLAGGTAAVLPALALRGGFVGVDNFVTLFVLVALDRADRARRAEPTTRHVVLAGVAAGLAAASKYPGGLVGLGVVTSLLLAPWSWRDRLGACLRATLAAFAALLLAMPALLLRGARVLQQLRHEASLYSTQRVGAYWEQALRRAEWDIPYPHAEVGWVFLGLAAAGLVLAVRDRALRPVLAAWTVFAAAALALLRMHFAFRAFRNLLPLVALAVVLAALAVARLARASRRPWVVPAVAAALALLYVPPLAAYQRQRATLRDSRREAIDWLAQRRGRTSLLIADAIVVLPEELRRLRPGEAAFFAWDEAGRAALGTARARWLLLPGDLQPGTGVPAEADRRLVLAGYRAVATFGEDLALGDAGAWNGNRRRLVLLERRRRPRGAQAGREPGFSATPPAAHSGQAASE